VQAPLAQLPWYHHLELLTKVDGAELRSWYAAAAVDRGWSRDVLALHIDARFPERAGKAVTNFATAMPPEQSDLAQQATCDPYLFDFLGSTEGWRERELEHKLVEHVGKFLIELGQGFAFVGQQVRLELDGEEFFCDLRPAAEIHWISALGSPALPRDYCDCPHLWVLLQCPRVRRMSCRV
jgi:predicted nuclease of restriction endonuclease-like (RecB) superfamily